MRESYRYGVEVLHLLVSPAHAYFGRAREGAADVPTTDAGRVELVAGKGIVGDRFFGKAAHKAMRGRGGVRCQVPSDGVLHRGAAVLASPVPLEPGRAGGATALRASRLP